MSRKCAAKKREVYSDPKYNEVLVTKLINQVMWDGKKSKAEKIVYDSLDIVATKAKDDQIKVLKEAIANIAPAVEVRSRRVGGATYQVPMEVRPERRQTLALRWLVEAARGRSEHTMVESLASEVRDAANKRGVAFKKCENTHKMAEANKAFAHYRW